jgi:hypothetical protein
VSSPVNTAAAALSGNSSVMGQSSVSNATTWVLTAGPTALTASTAYRWGVICAGP